MKWSIAAGKLIGVLALVPLLAVLPAHAQEAKPFSNEQLEQMTAQVALYPDSLLAQLFMATTYPDDFAAAAAWSKAHPDAKGDEAVTQVQNEPWDPSVASLVAFPEVLITLGDKTDWVRNMGDAFLAQPDDVMNAVQRLRQKAQSAGNLKTNEQIKVSTQKPEAAPAPTTTVVQQSAPPPQVIVIEPAQPSVVYVPAYNPTVVYGAWPYAAYPPYYYPPPPGYWWSRTIATGIAWGVAIGVNNALWGGCHWGGGWGHNSVDINVNRYNNINVNRRLDVNNKTANWNHNPERRGNTPYKGGDATRKNLENKYQSGSREQYRGKDASRDASREKAQQSMQARGVDAGSGSARERAQAMDKSAARDKAQGADKSAARDKAQSADRNAARQNAQSASRDNALKGANSPQAKQQADRGAASQKVADRSGGASRPAASSGGGGRPSAGGSGASRPSGGGGGGGGRAGGGGGGGGRGR